MFRGFGHGGLDGRRHDGCSEHGVGACGVDDFRYAEFVVVVFAFGVRADGAG
jgi:hypothetical protein